MQQTTSINKTDIYDKNLVASIEDTLCILGIPRMLSGYQYIVEAELLIIENSDCINRLKGEVYPKIAIQWKRRLRNSYIIP